MDDYWTKEDKRLAERHRTCEHDEGYCADGPLGLAEAQGADLSMIDPNLPLW